VQVASNDAVMSDLGGDVAQIIEPEPPPPIEPPEAPRPMESAPSTSTEPLPELIAPSGKLPGTAEKLDDQRAMESLERPRFGGSEIHRPPNRRQNLYSSEK